MLRAGGGVVGVFYTRNISVKLQKNFRKFLFRIMFCVVFIYAIGLSKAVLNELKAVNLVILFNMCR